MPEFTTEPCEVCGGVDRHAEGCPYDPTWRPEVDWSGQGYECPHCGRPYAHPDEADRCPCQEPPSTCLLCKRAGVPGVAENGVCDDCLVQAEEEAERHEWWEAQKTLDQGGPWY
jgi:hypothetical protein